MSTLLKQPAAIAKKLTQTIMNTASASVKTAAAIKTTKAKGDAAEDAALAHLQAAGLKLLERNYRTPGRGGGEIDLIMRDKDETLVFIEVRQRSGALHGGAAASIGATKRKRIVFAARFYLMRLARPPACRFDVVLVEAQITWLKAAFDAS
jgi:putative endonuclease